MNMKTINIIISVSVIAFFLILPNSCNFLDVENYFNETLRYDSIFKTKRNTERYLWATADLLPEEGDIFSGGEYTPGLFATDEAFSLGETAGYQLVRGSYAANSNPFNNFYQNMYQIVRKANTILAHVDEVRDMTNYDKSVTASFAIFLRAYAYYHLLNLYGPVVLQGDDLLESNETIEYYDRPRSTYDECIEYICGEFETASLYLPAESSALNYGRPTRGAALALVARLRLQHASPLYNGGTAARTIYGDFKRSTDGQHYFNQEEDNARWAIAALAAQRIMEMDYELHVITKIDDPVCLPFPSAATNPTWEETGTGARPFPEEILNLDFHEGGLADVNAYRSYLDMFNGEVLPVKNKEIIWGRWSPSVNNNINRCLPYQIFRGNNNMSISQKIVDAYYMDDGRTIDQAKENGYYTEVGSMANEKPFREGTQTAYYTLNKAPNGGDNIPVRNMYNNREMRFYASISFDGCFFEGITAAKAEEKNKKISYQYSANGGKAFSGNQQVNYPITGYALRKYLHREDAVQVEGARKMQKHFPIIRYAEILLSYAEALNNLREPVTVEWEGQQVTVERDEEEIARAFNPVRFRAGLPGLTEEELADPTTMQNIIERERMIEFMCENRRYFDVRRWGKYRESEEEPMMGMATDFDGELFYIRSLLNHPKAREREGSNNKYILMPLPLNEIRKMSMLDQNPGWER